MLSQKLALSPNVQHQLVGAPVEVSANITAKDAVPEVGLALKLAVGGVVELPTFR